MSYFNLDPSYKFKLNSMPRGKNSKTPIDNVCQITTNTIIIDYNSNCFLCGCDGWLPIPVGKVQDFNSLEEVWASPIAKVLQKDIADKKFTWCAVEHCGIRSRDQIRSTYELSINIDESCNLYCPSCRRDQIMHIDGPEVASKKQDIERIILWLSKFEHPINITLSGNGDPLASTIIRPLIKKYQPLPTQEFKLLTNGLLIKKQLIDSAILPNITRYSISIDAGSKDVYENVRRGGSWPVLLENLDFLNSLGKSDQVVLNFAVQNNNYHDLHNFINLCNKFNFGASIHQLDNWGTWNSQVTTNPDVWTLQNGTFMDNDVLDSNHINYAECQQIIKDLTQQNLSPRIIFSQRLLNLLKI